jgi:hypothetical protein
LWFISIGYYVLVGTIVCNLCCVLFPFGYAFIVSGQEMFNLTCISFLYFWVEYIIDLVAIDAVTCLKSTLNIDSEILRIIGNRENAYPKGKISC